MSRLSKLYQTMENLKELGLSINEDLIQEANELEEEIIKKERPKGYHRDVLS